MKTNENVNNLLICHQCDVLQDISSLRLGETAVCICCANKLYKKIDSHLDKLLAYVVASVILFILANIYPLISINIAGIAQETSLINSGLIFLEQENYALAVIVWFTSVFIPGYIIFGLFYILLSFRFQCKWPFRKPILKWLSRLLPWGMIDVFLLGLIVALVKLFALADVNIGIGFYAFSLLILVYAVIISSLECRVLWEHFDREEFHWEQCDKKSKRYTNITPKKTI